MQDKLIIGAAMGYNAAQVAPFIESLRRAGYAGDVALVVDRRLAAQIRRSEQFADVIVLSAPHWYPMKFGFYRRRRLLKILALPTLFPLWVLMRVLGRLPLTEERRLAMQMAIAKFSIPPTESRYLHYLSFIQRNTRYRRIIISDVRDVLFQKDPFIDLPVYGLAVGIESRSKKLGDEHWNRRFVTAAYGSEMLERLKDEAIACSGVTCGDRASMLAYLRMMATEICSRPYHATLECVDQGIHNVLLWTGRFPDFIRLEVLGSPLATLSDVESSALRLDENGRLLNRDGSVVSIVHQYDRLPELGPVLLRNLTGPGVAEGG